MRKRPIARSLVAAAVVSLGLAAVPAAAQASLLSDLLQPVVDLLGGGGSGSGSGGGGSDNSGPGNGQDDLPDPPPPAAPPPPMTPAPAGPTTPAPTAPSPSPATPAPTPVTPTPTPSGAPAPPIAVPPRHPVSPVARRFLVGRHLLSPPPGKVLGGLRPTLRWRGGPARVDLYNVQIFSATGRKVVSAFPRSRTLPVPAKRLAPGRRYVWRVWPYTRAHGYTKRPLAISWFATASRTVLAQRAA